MEKLGSADFVNQKKKKNDGLTACLWNDLMKILKKIFFFRETLTSPWAEFRAKFRPLGRLFCPNRPLGWALIKSPYLSWLCSTSQNLLIQNIIDRLKKIIVTLQNGLISCQTTVKYITVRTNNVHAACGTTTNSDPTTLYTAWSTINFLNIWARKTFFVITVKFELCGSTTE